MNTKIKIGITDLADPSLDLSWIDKLSTVDGAIIITKCLANASSEFIQALINNKDKIILHSTITGLGKTIFEPGVDEGGVTISRLSRLIDWGFPIDHIVVRIDPIIGGNLFSQFAHESYKNGLKLYCELICSIINQTYDLGVRRFRYSYLDLYDHVKGRLHSAGFIVPNFAVDFNEMKFWNYLFCNYEQTYHDIQFESCAEKFAPKRHQVGCISKRDFEILGLDQNECVGNCEQRPTCLCSANKVELLPYAKECKHNCLYCFIKH